MSGKSVGYRQKAFKDVESMKREDWHRRRLLRLEQVRQQSKDIATLVRQKVQSERDKQLGLVKERVNAQTQQWQVRKLKSLQREYENTLQNVGKGHSDAACQPNVEAIQKEEAEKIMVAAQKRGQEALQRLREEEAARRKVEEERRTLLNSVRSVEEARSAVVVSLPCPESTVGIKRMLSKKSVSVSAPTAKLCDRKSRVNNSRTALPEWSKRFWPQQALPLGIASTEYEMEQGDSSRAKSSIRDEEDRISTFMSSQGDALEGTKLVHTEQSFTEPLSKNSKRCVNRNADVQLYDFSTTYQSQGTNVSGVVEKVKATAEINAKDAADREFSVPPPHTKPSIIQAQIEKKRSKEALQRMHVQRDYRDLMGSLSALAKQNAAQCAYSNKPEKSFEQGGSQEDQLMLAVQNLLADAEVKTSDSTLEPLPYDTPDGSLIISQCEETPSTAPRLNLRRWHPPDVNMNDVSSPKPESPTDSIIIAPPPPVSGIAMSNRQESNERDIVLRSLVQRINNERHMLLQPSQQLSHEVVAQPGRSLVTNQQYIKKLEERVLQQREELDEQRSEVKRLDASIVVPDCIKQPLQNQENSPRSSSLTHESIIIEQSHSDIFDESSPSSSIALRKKLPLKKDKNCHSQNHGRDVGTVVSSSMKEKIMYSMDVSLSSVIMDQTENDSSGSKSLSLHGVQVVVKVCGEEEDSSESLSTGYSDVVKGVEIEEISSESVDDNVGVQKWRGNTKSGLQNKRGKDKSSVKSFDGVQLKTSKPSKVACKVTSNLPQEEVGQKPRESPSPSKKPAEKYHKTGQDRHVKTRRKETKIKKKRKEAENEMLELPASTSTSYLSPPDRVLSSLAEDIKTLIGLAQANATPLSTGRQRPEQLGPNQGLISYINRLLTMSRESIDRLNVSCSEISTPPSALFQPCHSVDEASLSLTEIELSLPVAPEVPGQFSGLNHDRVDFSVNPQVNPLQSCGDEDKRVPVNDSSKAEANTQLFFPISDDHESLMNMTRRCNENISILTKMIEEVRKQGLGHSPLHYDFDHSINGYMQSRSPLLMDSTAYMSPPPQVLEWANIAHSQGEDQRDKNMSLDPYGAAVMQLIADIRNQMAANENHIKTENHSSLSPLLEASVQGESKKEIAVMDTGRPKPPVAFWKNIERCNVSSPTEPHELSTIPELATTLPESMESHGSRPVSPHHAFTAPSSPGTPPDVIAELMRRNILTSPFAWAKKMNENEPADRNVSYKTSNDSELSSGKTGTSESDICASKETNSSSIQSQYSKGSTNRQTNVLMSPVDLYSSADEVEGDLRRMGIGWMGAMLRKTKEAGALSSTSSSEGQLVMTNTSDFKDLSDVINDERGELFSSSLRVSLGQSRGHSTPIKPPTDHSSSSGSQLV